MSFGKELIQSAEEALAIAKDEEPAGVFVPESVDVSAIRKKQSLSQAAFAERYGYISPIERNPTMVADTLAAA